MLTQGLPRGARGDGDLPNAECCGLILIRRHLQEEQEAAGARRPAWAPPPPRRPAWAGPGQQGAEGLGEVSGQLSTRGDVGKHIAHIEHIEHIKHIKLRGANGFVGY